MRMGDVSVDGRVLVGGVMRLDVVDNVTYAAQLNRTLAAAKQIAAGCDAKKLGAFRQ